MSAKYVIFIIEKRQDDSLAVLMKYKIILINTNYIFIKQARREGNEIRR